MAEAQATRGAEQLSVCSYNEIVPGIRVATIGVVDA